MAHSCIITINFHCKTTNKEDLSRITHIICLHLHFFPFVTIQVFQYAAQIKAQVFLTRYNNACLCNQAISSVFTNTLYTSTMKGIGQKYFHATRVYYCLHVLSVSQAHTPNYCKKLAFSKTFGPNVCGVLVQRMTKVTAICNTLALGTLPEEHDLECVLHVRERPDSQIYRKGEVDFCQPV